jgi:hypothetical protein
VFPPDCFENSDCDDDGDVCTYDGCVAGECATTLRVYGDVTGDGARNLLDVFCILDLIGGSPVGPECDASNADIEPCAGNGVLSILDIFAVLNAIGGTDPCECPGP